MLGLYIIELQEPRRWPLFLNLGKSIFIPSPASSDVILWDSHQKPSQLHWFTLSCGSESETGSPWWSLKHQQPRLFNITHFFPIIKKLHSLMSSVNNKYWMLNSTVEWQWGVVVWGDPGVISAVLLLQLICKWLSCGFAADWNPGCSDRCRGQMLHPLG